MKNKKKLTKQYISPIPLYYNGGMTDEQLNQLQTQQLNNNVNQGISQIPMWGQYYGLMHTASNVGKQLIERNPDGTPKTRVGNALDQTFTPHHEQAIESWKQGKKGRAVADMMGFSTLPRAFKAYNDNTNDSSQYTFANGGLMNNWSKDPFINMAARPYMYNNGGLVPNAQLEKQELMQFPDGSTAQVDAPSHANGGINLNLPNQTKIYSDKLKSSSGKTFAKEAEQFKNDKWQKILDDKEADPLKKKTAQMMFDKNQAKLDELFNEQESQKQVKAIKAFNKFQKKYGGEIPMFYNGGIMKYPDGGEFDNWFAQNMNNPKYSKYDMNQMQNEYNTLYPSQTNTFGNYNITGGHRSETLPYSNEPVEPIDNTDYFNAAIKGNQPQVGSVYTNDAWKNRQPEFEQRPGSQPNWYQRNKSDINQGAFQLGNFAAQNIGNLMYLAEQGKKYDRVNYGQVNPNLLSDKETLKDIDRSSYAVQRMLPSATGGHGGQALTALMANASNRDAAKAKTKMEFENINAGIKNQFGQYNKGLEIQGMIDEAQNKGKALSNYYQSISNIGRNSAEQSRDIRAEKNQQNQLDMLSKYLENMEYDKNTNSWKFKKSV